jgi:hypothetical protein
MDGADVVLGQKHLACVVLVLYFLSLISTQPAGLLMCTHKQLHGPYTDSTYIHIRQANTLRDQYGLLFLVLVRFKLLHPNFPCRGYGTHHCTWSRQENKHMPLSSDARYTLGHAHIINTTKLVGRVLSTQKKLTTADQQEAVFVIHFCTYAGFYSQKCGGQ